MLRIFALALIFTAAYLTALPQSQAARTERIAVVVNDQAISMSDVNDRLKLVISSSGLPDSKDIRAKLTSQVINDLINEQLQLQEAERLDISISADEVDSGFAQIATQNNIDAQKFETMLRQGGINVGTMRRQIESQIAWSRVIQLQMRPQVNVSDSDVDEVMNRLAHSKGTKEYRVAEISLPIDEPEQESNVKQLADRLVSQLRVGKASFYQLAQQFSKSAGAAQGGNLGWVQQGQLPEELDQALIGMSKGDVSGAIKSVSGYHILYVRDKRTISDESMPQRKQIMNTLGTERLERMQRRYLLDLKAAAFIENRV